jgi:hypothetical protein
MTWMGEDRSVEIIGENIDGIAFKKSDVPGWRVDAMKSKIHGLHEQLNLDSI